MTWRVGDRETTGRDYLLQQKRRLADAPIPSTASQPSLVHPMAPPSTAERGRFSHCSRSRRKLTCEPGDCPTDAISSTCGYVRRQFRKTMRCLPFPIGTETARRAKLSSTAVMSADWHGRLSNPRVRRFQEVRRRNQELRLSSRVRRATSTPDMTFKSGLYPREGIAYDVEKP